MDKTRQLDTLLARGAGTGTDIDLHKRIEILANMHFIILVIGPNSF